MMKPTASTNPQTATTSTPLEATALDSMDLTLLAALMAQDQPVTERKLVKVTGLSADQVRVNVESLCAIGLVLRLRTLIPSYTVRR